VPLGGKQLDAEVSLNRRDDGVVLAHELFLINFPHRASCFGERIFHVRGQGFPSERDWAREEVMGIDRFKGVDLVLLGMFPLS